jgi:hypothetical protein
MCRLPLGDEHEVEAVDEAHEAHHTIPCHAHQPSNQSQGLRRDGEGHTSLCTRVLEIKGGILYLRYPYMKSCKSIYICTCCGRREYLGPSVAARRSPCCPRPPGPGSTAAPPCCTRCAPVGSHFCSHAYEQTSHKVILHLAGCVHNSKGANTRVQQVHG